MEVILTFDYQKDKKLMETRRKTIRCMPKDALEIINKERQKKLISQKMSFFLLDIINVNINDIHHIPLLELEKIIYAAQIIESNFKDRIGKCDEGLRISKIDLNLTIEI